MRGGCKQAVQPAAGQRFVDIVAGGIVAGGILAGGITHAGGYRPAQGPVQPVAHGLVQRVADATVCRSAQQHLGRQPLLLLPAAAQVQPVAIQHQRFTPLPGRLTGAR